MKNITLRSLETFAEHHGIIEHFEELGTFAEQHGTIELFEELGADAKARKAYS